MIMIHEHASKSWPLSFQLVGDAKRGGGGGGGFNALFYGA